MTPPSRLYGLQSQQDGLRKSLSAMREPGLTAKALYAAHTRGYLSMMSEAQNFPPMGTFACSTNRAAFSAAGRRPLPYLCHAGLRRQRFSSHLR